MFLNSKIVYVFFFFFLKTRSHYVTLGQTSVDKAGLERLCLSEGLKVCANTYP